MSAFGDGAWRDARPPPLPPQEPEVPLWQRPGYCNGCARSVPDGEGWSGKARISGLDFWRLCARCAIRWGLLPGPPAPVEPVKEVEPAAFGCLSRYWWAWDSWARCARERGHEGEHAGWGKKCVERDGRRRYIPWLYRWRDKA
ncbi:MAG: hypothetical protein QOE90_809 [Thermoplasmata archaeon]|jgi:hypothetical protein|nr:hypothetical protein [Thermoplasmata archaeon]